MFGNAKNPCPAIAFVGRHNSGKTTLIEKIICELTNRGFDVGSVKHHTHGNFEIDVPGKDSWRHKQAGASEVVIASPCKIALVKDIEEEVECSQIVESMTGHDIIIVEGYRQSDIPYIEVMRNDNPRDVEFSKKFIGANDSPVAVVSDIVDVRDFCKKENIKCFGLDDVSNICDYLQKYYARKKVSLVIQAGGESRRMGFPKEELIFEGKHVIESQIERFAPYVDEVVVTSNHPERLNFLKKDFGLPVKICEDIPPRKGALTGMHTAFAMSEFERVCCIACDMFFASEHLLFLQEKLMNEERFDVVIPKNKHGLEPFHALYDREKCLEAVRRALSQGEQKVVSFLNDENLNVYEMAQEEVRQAVPRGGCFANINTPEDLARFRA